MRSCSGCTYVALCLVTCSGRSLSRSLRARSTSVLSQKSVKEAQLCATTKFELVSVIPARLFCLAREESRKSRGEDAGPFAAATRG